MQTVVATKSSLVDVICSKAYAPNVIGVPKLGAQFCGNCGCEFVCVVKEDKFNRVLHCFNCFQLFYAPKMEIIAA